MTHEEYIKRRDEIFIKCGRVGYTGVSQKFDKAIDQLVRDVIETGTSKAHHYMCPADNQKSEDFCECGRREYLAQRKTVDGERSKNE